MASYEYVNYSLRPSKSIQRQIVFEGVRTLQLRLGVGEAAYVGFGSIWFTDFVMAHKLLGIRDMVSIEKAEIGYARARFNRPYATVRVIFGSSGDVLPGLYDDEKIGGRPWVVWLDYDGGFDERLGDDVRSVVGRVPCDSVLLVTFNGSARIYGRRLRERPGRVRQLFGDLVPDDQAPEEYEGNRMQDTLADLVSDLMQSVAIEGGRPDGFAPAFRLVYRDGAPMVTVGGVIPRAGAAAVVAEVVEEKAWVCRPAAHIVAPHLTVREALALQARLPRKKPLTREAVQALGFDLEEEQIRAFEKYYREYPSFARIVA